MNRNHYSGFAATTAVVVLAFSTFSQDAVTPVAPTVRIQTVPRRAALAPANSLNGAVKTSDLMGMHVQNYEGEALGTVEDLAIDVESGRILQVILSTGGFIGFGGTLSTVPPGALHHDVSHSILHLDATKEKLKAAPQFQMSKWAEAGESQRLTQVYGHYDQTAALDFIAPAGAEKSDKNVVGEQNVAWDQVPSTRLSQAMRATKVVGMSVRNLQDEKLGSIENMVVDLPSGRVLAVIVSSGGFLGMGNEFSALPPSAFRFNAERDGFRLDASKERLAQAAHFRADQWPDFTEPVMARGVYQAFSVEPYFTTNRVVGADNTASNVRDRNSGTVTPLDQGNSRADVDMTAKIRKGIMADKDMSVNAQNVKIITNQGQVTLRGPVASADERRAVGEIANGVALAANVDNQLEVQ